MAGTVGAGNEASKGAAGFVRLAVQIPTPPTVETPENAANAPDFRRPAASLALYGDPIRFPIEVFGDPGPSSGSSAVTADDTGRHSETPGALPRCFHVSRPTAAAWSSKPTWTYRIVILMSGCRASLLALTREAPSRVSCVMWVCPPEVRRRTSVPSHCARFGERSAMDSSSPRGRIAAHEVEAKGFDRSQVLGQFRPSLYQPVQVSVTRDACVAQHRRMSRRPAIDA